MNSPVNSQLATGPGIKRSPLSGTRSTRPPLTKRDIESLLSEQQALSGRGAVVSLFLVDGDPTSLVSAGIRGWAGKATVFSREAAESLKTSRKHEFALPGFYLLDGGDIHYVGEGDPVGERIYEHLAKKHFWTRGVFLTGELNKAHIQHIEAKLIRFADMLHLPLDNQQRPEAPTLNEEDKAIADNFLKNALLLLPLLGFTQFVVPKTQEEPEVPSIIATNPRKNVEPYKPRAGEIPAGTEFVLAVPDLGPATVQKTVDGVLVRKGSPVVYPPSPRFQAQSSKYFNLQQSLVTAEVIAVIDGVAQFTRDQEFDSPSAAASVIMGALSGTGGLKDAGNTSRTYASYNNDLKHGGLGPDMAKQFPAVAYSESEGVPEHTVGLIVTAREPSSSELATLVVTPKGYVLLAGSKVAPKSDTMKPSVAELRQKLVDAGVIDDSVVPPVLAKNCRFGTQGRAAYVVKGRETGSIWKSSINVPLKDYKKASK